MTSVARRPLPAFVLLLALFGATAAQVAGAGPSVVAGAGPSAVSGAASSAIDGASSIVLRAYFLMRDPATGDPKLVPVLRQVPPTTATAAAALRQLLAGPSATEASASPRIISLIPKATTLLGVAISGGTATVNLSRTFASRGSTTSMHGRLAQVVYTVTQFATVSRVRFRVEGTPLTTFSGTSLANPVTRATFRNEFLPDIFVDRPAWGAALGNPGRVTGLANVFEATFRVAIMDGRERGLVDRPVMATCGTGCWGSFDVTLRYSVSRPQWGRLRVYNLSAKDGQIESLRDYPVWLTPAP